jgi:glycosyltransferase involved in cell wall biosynthesis
MIAQRFWPRVGATETRAAQLACELVDRGAEVTVVTARWHVEWPAEVHFHGLPVVRLAPPPTGLLSGWWWRRALARWLKRNEDHFDVVLVWGLMGEARAAIEAIGPLAGASGFEIEARRANERKANTATVPVVLVPERTGWHGDCFQQARVRGGSRLQRACSRAAAFVAPSPAARRELEAAGYPREKIQDVPPGAPLLPSRTVETQMAARELLADASTLLQLVPRSPLVVSTARLAADRGWETVLTAWSIVARQMPAARLWLAGEAPQAVEVVARINRLGIAAGVNLVGQFDDVAQLLSAADLHVSPAADGALQPILEAMSAGVPSVAADVPLNCWLLGDAAAEQLVPPDDAKSMAAAIVRLLQDPESRGRLGTSNWERATRNFALPAMVDAFCRVLEAVRRH